MGTGGSSDSADRPCADKELLTDPAVNALSILLPGTDQLNSVLTLTDTHVYWVDNDSGVKADLGGTSNAVMRVAKTGGEVEQVFAAPADQQLMQVVAAGEKIYALYKAQNGLDIGTFLGEVDGSADRLNPLNSAHSRGWDSLLTGLGPFHDGSIWLSTSDDQDNDDREGRIVRIDPATGEETVVYENPINPASFTDLVDVPGWAGFWQEDIYFTANAGFDGLWKAPADGGGPASVVLESFSAMPSYFKLGGGFVVSGMNGVIKQELTEAAMLDLAATQIFDSRTILDSRIVRVLAADDQSVIVADGDKTPRPAYEVAIDGSEARDVICDGIRYDSLQGDATHWYWIDGDLSEGPRTIARAPR
ncbi:MAG: hypothetical protein OEZ06_17860 [Myxococcales bacterium]|nr:hypothetical protein [Myxococcales bacterium]